MNEFDPNKVAVGVATNLAKDMLKSISSYLPAKIRDKYNLYFNNFEEYLERTERTCSFVRTIINKETPGKY